MDALKNFMPWLFIIVGALITYLAKPILNKKLKGEDDESVNSERILYITKLIGMVLVIIGAAMIFIAGGTYGRS